jgi:hypothetical protein
MILIGLLHVWILSSKADVWLTAYASILHLRLAPSEQSPWEMKIISVDAEPGWVTPFASVEPGSSGELDIQSTGPCIPRTLLLVFVEVCLSKTTINKPSPKHGVRDWVIDMGWKISPYCFVWKLKKWLSFDIKFNFQNLRKKAENRLFFDSFFIQNSNFEWKMINWPIF